MKNGAHLASIHSVQENEFINTIHKSIQPRKWSCIGGQKDGSSFKWTDGSPFDYQNWVEGEPNFKDNEEHCMNIYDNGLWNDLPCDYRLIDSYVCKKEK